MNPYTILCVDDEREVLDSLVEDLDSLSSHFDIEAAESVEEAREIVAELEGEGRKLALILCDQIMPGVQGVNFLVDLTHNEATREARKLLVTGQASHEDTIQAINCGGLDYYVSKPWGKENLLNIVVGYLTQYVLTHDENPMTYVQVLDDTLIFQAIHKQG